MFEEHSLLRFIRPPCQIGRHEHYVRPVHSFVCYQNCEHGIFKIELTDFDGNWHNWSTGQGHETLNLQGQKVKGRGQTRPMIDL